MLSRLDAASQKQPVYEATQAGSFHKSAETCLLATVL